MLTWMQALKNMKAICIDNSNKPEHISNNEWLEEGAIYTITDIVEMDLQKGKLGIALKEVKLTQASAPYEYYSLERFLIIPSEARIMFGNPVNFGDVHLKKSKENIYDNDPIDDSDLDIYDDDADLSSLN